MCSWKDCSCTPDSADLECAPLTGRHTWQHTHSSVCIINCLGADGSQFVSLCKVQCHSGAHITARHPKKKPPKSSPAAHREALVCRISQTDRKRRPVRAAGLCPHCCGIKSLQWWYVPPHIMQPDPFLKMKSLQRYNYLPAHVRPDPQLCCGVTRRGQREGAHEQPAKGRL